MDVSAVKKLPLDDYLLMKEQATLIKIQEAKLNEYSIEKALAKMLESLTKGGENNG